MVEEINEDLKKKKRKKFLGSKRKKNKKIHTDKSQSYRHILHTDYEIN